MGDLQTAVQNPRHAFRDPVLKSGRVELSPLGLPRPRSGGFAVTFKITTGNQAWAVRCFHREVKDLEQRYAALTKFLKTSAVSGLTEFEYQPDGVLVQGKHFPIVKMAWVEGQTLGSYVAANVNDRRRLSRVTQHFRETISHLEATGAAHGDLQHGNVVISGDRVNLIDYDGMFVPGMQIGASNELGHVNYQSPLRTEKNFNSGIDRFSAVVIDLALQALQEQPALWDKYATGDNLLFQARDFVTPTESPLLAELRRLPRLAPQMDLFEKLCRTPLDQLPRLEDFLSGRVAIGSLGTASSDAYRKVRLRQFEAVAATDVQALMARRGQYIELVGQITDVVPKFTQGGKPYVFVDFGDWRSGAFRLVIWSDVLERFQSQGISLSSYTGKWISITGLADAYGSRPQISVGDPSEIHVLKSKADANTILQEGAANFLVTVPGHVTRSRNQDLRKALQTKEDSTRKSTTATSSPAAPKSHVKVSPPSTKSKTSNDQLRRQLASNATPPPKADLRVSTPPKPTQVTPPPFAAAQSHRVEVKPSATATTTQSNPVPTAAVDSGKSRLSCSPLLFITLAIVISAVLLAFGPR